jgi:hemolysin activation/secretion protein
MGSNALTDKGDGCLLFFAKGIGLVALLAAAAQNGMAQTAVTIERGAAEGLRRQEERTREQQLQLQPKSDVLSPSVSTKVSTDLPVESPCFVIREIALTGKGIGRFGWLQDAGLPFMNRCIGVEGLRRIASALDGKLIELGYATTRVSLPQQNLHNGTLELVLHVGRISEVRMVKAGDAKQAADDNWGTWRNAFPGIPSLGPGDILNIRDLEQGVEQMKRLPSQAVATRIEPGAEPDTSVVYIERQSGSLGDRIRGGVTVDNSGSRTLGRSQLSAYLALDNPLGLNDILNLSGNSNLDQPDPNHRSQSASFNYSIPWGYNTFTISDSHNRFAQVVQGTTVNFLSSGTSDTAEFKWHRTFIRTASAKFGLYAGVATRHADSFLDDVELIVQRRRTTRLEAGVTYKRLIGQGDLDIDLGYQRGMPWFSAQDDFPQADGAVNLTNRPQIWTLNASYNQPFALGKQAFQYTGSIHAQATNDALLSVDQISIGNRYSVRGFDGDSVLLAESGFYFRNDLSMPANLVPGVDTQIYLGVDAGRVWGPSEAQLIGSKLAGAAIGMRGRWKSLQMDASLGTPLYKPEGFKTQRWSPSVSLTYAF